MKRNYLFQVGDATSIEITEDSPQKFLEKISDFSKSNPDQEVSILIRDPESEPYDTFSGKANDLRSAFKKAIPETEHGKPTKRFYSIKLAQVSQMHNCILKVMRET